MHLFCCLSVKPDQKINIFAEQYNPCYYHGKKQRSRTDERKKNNALTMKISECKYLLLGGLTQEGFCPCLLILLWAYCQGHSLEALKGRIQMLSTAR